MRTPMEVPAGAGRWLSALPHDTSPSGVSAPEGKSLPEPRWKGDRRVVWQVQGSPRSLAMPATEPWFCTFCWHTA